MSNKVFDKKIQRIIGQVRFRPTLESYQHLPKTANIFVQEYEDWQIDNNNATLVSPKEKKFLEIKSDTISYLNEGQENVDEAKTQIGKIFQENVNEHSVNQIRRIGFRNTQVLSCSFSYEEITDLIYRKFYSQDEKIKRISTDTPRDVVFVLDGFKNGFLNHVQIGPVVKEEALNLIKPQFKTAIETLTEVSLFIDVDVFIADDLTNENCLNKLNDITNENLRIVKEYIKYLST